MEEFASDAKPAVVLVRTQEEGNIGSTARAMANMGLEQLVLVAPQATIGRVARAFAVGAGEILDRARIEDDLETALAPYRRVVGTTSLRGRSLGAQPITPQELPSVLDADPAGTSTALVFGPEASGLKVEELTLCSPCVRIPCSPVQPTLNLAQAVLIVAWELAKARRASAGPASAGRVSEDADEGDAFPLASQRELAGLFEQMRPVLGEVGFDRDGSFETVMRDLRLLAGRASLTEREVKILRGICRRTRRSLEQRGASQLGEPASAAPVDAEGD